MPIGRIKKRGEHDCVRPLSYLQLTAELSQ